MKFVLSVRMDNAAFDDDPKEELACILHALGVAFNNMGEPLKPKLGAAIFDSNGNRVGAWGVE